MSWSRSRDIDRMVEAMRRALHDEQREIWDKIEEDRYVAVMDKKPTLVGGDEFINNPIPVPPYVVEPFFPTGGLCLVHGKRGLGKTMLATALVRSICTGEQFLGRFDVRKGTVVYIQLDMVDFIFRDRLLDAGNYYDHPDWFVLTGVANMMRARENDDWVQDINAVRPDLIIIDTLRKAHTLPENDSDSAGRFYAKLRELFGVTAVMLLHHERKTSHDGITNPGEMFRGSSAWIDDVDVGIRLFEKGKQLYVGFSKTRTCKDIDDFPVYIDEATMSIVSSIPNTLTRARASKKGFSQADAMRMELEKLRKANPEFNRRQFKQEATQHLKTLGYNPSHISKVINGFL